MDIGPDLSGDAIPHSTVDETTSHTEHREEDNRNGDPDTCRICRGEASGDEPLFYPCKCSGSIKFVHQACLMEWLSRSQKKHCELCKTPFRFTKLYHPQMPKAVPLEVFIKQAAVHTMRGLLTWSRWNLVAFVWLFWVPWSMRKTWRLLFWLGDGGWFNAQDLENNFVNTSGRFDSLTLRSSTPTNQGSLLSLNTTTLPRIPNGFITHWPPFFYSSNSSAGGPAIFRIVRQVLTGMLRSPPAASISSAALNSTTHSRPYTSHPSLLSDLSFLKNLTRWTSLNSVVIDILEGQLITLFVAITIVLVFLIREWVVQQQPGMNIGAAFDVAPAVPAANVVQEDAGAPQAGDNLQAGHRIDNRDNQLVDVDTNPTETATDVANGLVSGIETVQGVSELSHGFPDQPQSDSETISPIHETFDTSSNTFPSTLTDDFDDSDFSAQPEDLVDSGPSHGSHRPFMPAKSAIARAGEFHRTIEEESKAAGQSWPGVEVFMDIWKRADCSPSEVLKIIRDEGREKELAWVVAAMKRLQLTAEGNDRIEVEIRSLRSVADTEGHEEKGSNASKESWELLEDGSAANSAHQHIPQALIVADDLSETGNSLQSPMVDGPDSMDICTGPRGEHETTAPAASSRRASASETLDSSQQPENNLAQIRSESGNGETVNGNEDAGTREGEPQVTITSSPNVVRVINQEPQNITEAVSNWLWGGVVQTPVPINELAVDDEHLVDDVNREEPFVPIAHGRLAFDDDNVAEDGVRDLEVLRAAAEAGIDPNDIEAIEEGEDIDGIMELIGMQGPLIGLVQHGTICAVIISLVVFFGVWVPYIVGKVFLVFLANPITLVFKLPLGFMAAAADLVVDMTIFLGGCAFYWLDTLLRMAFTPVGWLIPFVGRSYQNTVMPEAAARYASEAAERLAKIFVATSDSFSDSDVPVFSILAHESLRKIQDSVVDVSKFLLSGVCAVAETPASEILRYSRISSAVHRLLSVPPSFFSTLSRGVIQIMAAAQSMSWINPLSLKLNLPQRTQPPDYALVHWSVKDQVLAIIFGYICFSVAGAVYLKVKAALRDEGEDQPPESAMVDALNQAGGVMKVILIISIEMIVFPLYCGLLLDLALLPLFQDATLLSRISFTIESPATSLFVHWFVGTCYMFHFALFVAMCREILRHGVLYFIRDPDDPTFHPVRDVLERSLHTQLRKIAFSALVYGALVIVCLGAVVWGLSCSAENISPIHWSSNEPVLEFPVDLLVYNFLMPVAVRFLRPSKGLRELYSWWFRKCARLLRLTNFLFGERMEDEEGYFVDRSSYAWIKQLRGTERDGVSTADDTTDKARATAYISEASSLGKAGTPVFCRNGRFVRAPASDQVRIPRGGQTFIEVDESGNRVDGRPDNDEGLHGRKNPMFSQVYIPPRFRLRIAAFVLLLWLFAATTGLGITVIPLLFGRLLFTRLVPTHHRVNDVYAFAIGVYFLGGPIWLAIQYRHTIAIFMQSIRQRASQRNMSLAALRLLLHRVTVISLRVLRILYFYSAFTLLLPALFAFVFELYFMIPLHTYFSRHSTPSNQHTMHFIQDWTLGVLYVKVAGRLILHYSDTRPAQALRALVAPQNNGASWLNPDVRLATRAFIFPATLLMAVALSAPLGLGWLLVHTTWIIGADGADKVVLFRYSYPAVLALALAGVFAGVLSRALQRWRMMIRDEVYLIGERLHNFGEKRPAVPKRLTMS